MPVLKNVKVKRTIYSGINDPVKLNKYLNDLMAMGNAAPLYTVPNIIAAFYALGVLAYNALGTAMTVYSGAPTKGNRDVVLAKMVLVVNWLNGYADKVEVIANADTNRTTREEAFANIQLSFLTPQKLANASKGKPASPTFTCKKSGSDVLCEVTNGVEYNPSSTTFFAVELPVQPTVPPLIPDPDVSLNGDQINVVFYAPGHYASQSNGGKGAAVTFKSLITGKKYAIYAFSQNGKKLISTLSEPVIVQK